MTSAGPPRGAPSPAAGAELRDGDPRGEGPGAGQPLDAQNPWPGLSPFDETAAPFFLGREVESETLLRLVADAALTVLFGKSGLGKTSLLLAGLFPRLRRHDVLPIYIRLDTRDPSGVLVEQAASALEREIAARTIDAPPPRPGDSLWAHLHSHDAQWWSRRNRPLTPLFVFDQFEEVFTLGATNSDAIDRLRLDLADLVENRIPVDLSRRLEGLGSADRFDLRGQRYKILLSFREDFLPDVEGWKHDLPSLMRNRFRLLPMDADHALQVVGGRTPRGAAHELMTDETAKAIVRFVAAAQAGTAKSGESGRPQLRPEAAWDRLEIEPALLSLVCRGLNEMRKARKRQSIDAALLAQTGPAIIADFYRRAVADVPEATRRFIENELITEGGFRDSYPVQDAVDQGWLTEPLLRRLIDRRLLRISHQLGADRVELIHDRLTDVVREERDRERERIRARRQARRRWLEGAVGLALAGLSFVFFSLWQSAQKSEARARAALKDAVAGRLVMQSRAMLEGRKAAAGDVAMLLAAAGFRLKPDDDALGALHDALKSPRLVEVVGCSGPVIALGPDGRTAATVGDNSLRLCDLVTGQPRGAVMPGHGARIASAAFSPDGTTLASGSSDATIRRWDAATGELIGEPLRGHRTTVTSVEFSPDGSVLASGSSDGALRFWDIAAGKLRSAPSDSHDGAVLRLAFSADGRMLASGSVDQTVRAWDVTHATLRLTMQGHGALVAAVAIAPDGRTVASGGGDRAVRLWDATTGRPRDPPLVGHRDAVTRIAFSPDGRVLASGSADRTVRLWDAATGKPLGEPLAAHTGALSSIGFAPDGRVLVSGGLDRTVRFWDVAPPRHPHAPLKHGSEWVLGVAVSPDGRTLASSSLDGSVRLWRTSTGEPVGRPLVGHTEGIPAIAFSPDGATLATGSLDGTLRLWDVASGAPRGAPQRHGDAIWSIAFSPDGKSLASGSSDRTVRQWDAARGLAAGPPLEGHGDRVTSVAFSPDGRQLVSGSDDATLRLWNAASGATVAVMQGHGAGIAAVAFSPNGRSIASASYDATLRRWDAATGRPHGGPLHGHSVLASSIAFSPDGMTLVSGGGDNTLRFWSADSGQPRGSPLVGHTAPISGVAFLPDGRSIVSASWDTTVRFWDAPDAWIDRLCAKVVRNLSPAEWKQYAGDVPYIEQCPGLPSPPE